MPKVEPIKTTIVIPSSKAVKPQPTRVVASKKQLLVLKPFYARVGVDPSNEDLDEAARQTGLDAAWIRKWLRRQHNPRIRTKANAPPTTADRLAFPPPPPDSSAATSVSAFYLEPPSDSATVHDSLPPSEPLVTPAVQDDLFLLTMTPSSSRPDISRVSSAPELPTTSSLLFEREPAGSELSYEYNFDTGYDLQVRSLTQSPGTPFYARTFSYEPMMVADSFLQYPEDADPFKEPSTTVKQADPPEHEEPHPATQRVTETANTEMNGMSVNTASVQTRELDTTTTQAIEVVTPLPAQAPVSKDTYQHVPATIPVQQAQSVYAPVNPQVVPYTLHIPTYGTAHMRQPVYPLRPVSFQMRYGDMVALLKKVHEEYRERQASEETDVDVSMGDESSVSSVESASLQTPMDSPMLGACAYTPSKTMKSEVAPLEYRSRGSSV